MVGMSYSLRKLLTQFTLRDLCWFTVVAAVFAFGYRDRMALQRIGDKEERLDFVIERYNKREATNESYLHKTLQGFQEAQEKERQHWSDEHNRQMKEVVARLVEAESRAAQAEKSP
jgi:hypothetical protein